VHISAIERAGLTTLAEGQLVEYEIIENGGRLSADLKVLKKATE
jgi:CspA family cold shock protein